MIPGLAFLDIYVNTQRSHSQVKYIYEQSKPFDEFKEITKKILL